MTIVWPPSLSIQEPESIGQVGPDIKLSELLPHKLVIQQERDSEIMNLKRGALNEREAEKVLVCYFVNNNNVLMRKWRSLNIPASHKWGVVYQVVVQPPYRKDILVLAHDMPLVGHLGVDKTYRKVLYHFYWPRVYSDVKKFCRMHHPCQLAGFLSWRNLLVGLCTCRMWGDHPLAINTCYHNVCLNPLSRSHFSAAWY